MFPYRTSVVGQRPPTLTLALLLVCTFVFFFEYVLSPADVDALILRWGVVPARQIAALTSIPPRWETALLPMVTAMFLHGGWGHLFGNMVFLWVFGRSLESTVGHARFLLIYVLGGIGASVLQVLVSPSSHIPMVGASGAIAALLGAYLRRFPRSWVSVIVPVFIFPLFFEIPALFFLGFWFLEQLIAGTALALSPMARAAGGIAWWAHVGGFVSGLVLAPFIFPQRLRAEFPAPTGAWRTHLAPRRLRGSS